MSDLLVRIVCISAKEDMLLKVITVPELVDETMNTAGTEDSYILG